MNLPGTVPDGGGNCPLDFAGKVLMEAETRRKLPSGTLWKRRFIRFEPKRPVFAAPF